MKLPVQAAAVVREGLAWPSRGSSVLASSAAPTGPSSWLGCPNCQNPCERHGYRLCTCPTSGTSTCCHAGKGCAPAIGGACVCNL